MILEPSAQQMYVTQAFNGAWQMVLFIVMFTSQVFLLEPAKDLLLWNMGTVKAGYLNKLSEYFTTRRFQKDTRRKFANPY